MLSKYLSNEIISLLKLWSDILIWRIFLLFLILLIKYPFVVMFIYQTGDAVFKSGALLVLISLVTSIIVGIAGNGLYKYLTIHYHLNSDLELVSEDKGENNEL